MVSMNIIRLERVGRGICLGKVNLRKLGTCLFYMRGGRMSRGTGRYYLTLRRGEEIIDLWTY